MKRKTLRLDGVCFDFLDQYDARSGPHGKNEMARAGLHVAEVLDKHMGPEGLKRCAKLAREGRSDELLDAFYSALPAGDDEAEREKGGTGAPPRGDGAARGDSDDGGRALSPVPDAGPGGDDESSPQTPSPAGDPDGNDSEGPDSGAESDDKNRSGGAVSNAFRSILGN